MYSDKYNGSSGVSHSSRPKEVCCQIVVKSRCYPRVESKQLCPGDDRSYTYISRIFPPICILQHTQAPQLEDDTHATQHFFLTLYIRSLQLQLLGLCARWLQALIAVHSGHTISKHSQAPLSGCHMVKVRVKFKHLSASLNVSTLCLIMCDSVSSGWNLMFRVPATEHLSCSDAHAYEHYRLLHDEGSSTVIWKLKFEPGHKDSQHCMQLLCKAHS